MDDLYCQIYIDTDFNPSYLLEILGQVFKGSISLRSISCKLFEITLFSNQSANKEKACSDDDGFLYYPYYLEIEPFDLEELGFTRNAYIAEIKSILSFFSNKKIPSAIACEFENEI
jgi:hypothetical protein